MGSIKRSGSGKEFHFMDSVRCFKAKRLPPLPKQKKSLPSQLSLLPEDSSDDKPSEGDDQKEEGK